MTAQELLSNYAKAENEFFTATETIRKNKEILIEENQVKEIFAQFCVIVNSDADYNRFIDTILQHILTNIIYETETSKSSL